ncbi:hypothetical protein FKP32DRAFT_1758110 [Trametes sanguinea]|nr:hypothetical protein FKP32DRAFT_1758110 [Trametes sanguinea]
MPISVADPGAPPLLKSTNLQGLGSVKSGKVELLHSYVRTQEAYLACYASEGRAVMASWAEEPPSLSSKEGGVSALRDVEIESGFGTPLLKPRVRNNQPSSANERESEELHKNEPGRPIKDSAKNATATRDKISARVSPLENRTSTLKANKSRDCEPAVENLKTGSKPKQGGADIAPSQAKAREKLPKTTKHPPAEADDEHRARLAARKERRRAKRAIVEPVSQPLDSTSGEDSDGAHNPKRASKGKKPKGLNVPAGLALLHGFSAVNLGKNRLTIRPDPLVGVFNRGKASAKASTKKRKPAKSAQTAKAFSEQRFLNKYGKRRYSSASEDSESSCDEQGSTIIDERPRIADGSTRRKNEVRQSDPPERKRARSVPDDSSFSDGATKEQDPHCDSSPAKKRARTRRADSPVWDIELASGVLAFDADGSCTPVASEVAKPASTVVLDIRADTARWTASRAADSLRDHVKPPQEAPSEASSIAPSQSASQAAIRRLDPPLEAASAAMFSKYFLMPPPSVPMIETTMLQDAPSIPSPQASPSSKQSSLGLAAETKSGFLVPNDHLGCSISFHSSLPPAATASHCDAGRTDYGSTVDRSYSFEMLLSDSSLAERSGSALTGLSGPPSPVGSRPPSPITGASSFSVSYDPPTSDHCMSIKLRKTPRRRRRHRPGSSSLSCSAAYAFASDPEPHEMLLASARADSMGVRFDYADVTERPGPGDRESFCLPAIPYLNIGDPLDDALTYHDDSLRAEYEVPFQARQDEGGSPLLDHGYCNLGMNPSGASNWEYDLLYGVEACLEGPLDGSTGELLDSMSDDVASVDYEVQDDPDSSENALVWTSGDCSSFGPGLEVDRVGSVERFGDEAIPMELEVDFEDEDLSALSEPGLKRSVLGSVQPFSQGRALLLGLSPSGLGAADSGADLSKVEVDVAKSLKGHWQPQRV